MSDGNESAAFLKWLESDDSIQDPHHPSATKTLCPPQAKVLGYPA